MILDFKTFRPKHKNVLVEPVAAEVIDGTNVVSTLLPSGLYLSKPAAEITRAVVICVGPESTLQPGQIVVTPSTTNPVKPLCDFHDFTESSRYFQVWDQSQFLAHTELVPVEV